MTATASEDIVPPETSANKDAAVSRILKLYSLGAAGVGIIPIPMLDVMLTGGIQLKMVYDLAKVFEVPFQTAQAKALIGSLVGSVVPFGLGYGITGHAVASLTKTVPFVGNILSLALSPALASASTYAVGKVFSEHFQTGGTLLTFDADQMRDYYRREFEAARQAQQGSGAPAEPQPQP